MMNKWKKRLLGLFCMVWIVLAGYSWLGNLFGLPVRNLFAESGLRWLFSYFVDNLLHTTGVYLLLLLSAGGALGYSGWTDAARRMLRISSEHSLTFVRKSSFRLSVFIGLLYYIGVILLPFLTRGIFLNASGGLFPSPYSRAFVPLVAAGLFLVAIVYGFFSGKMHRWSDICDALVYGIRKGAFLLLYYFYIMEIKCTFFYIFG